MKGEKSFKHGTGYQNKLILMTNPEILMAGSPGQISARNFHHKGASILPNIYSGTNANFTRNASSTMENDAESVVDTEERAASGFGNSPKRIK